MNIQITPSAAKRIREQLTQRGKGVGLRLGVKAAGCSGFRYVMDYADAVTADDTVFEHEGAQVIVDHSSLPMLAGSTLDFLREGLNQRFRVNNPQVQDQCGCGDSFSLAGQEK